MAPALVELQGRDNILIPDNTTLCIKTVKGEEVVAPLELEVDDAGNVNIWFYDRDNEPILSDDIESTRRGKKREFTEMETNLTGILSITAILPKTD